MLNNNINTLSSISNDSDMENKLINNNSTNSNKIIIEENIPNAVKYYLISQLFFVLVTIHIRVICGKIDIDVALIFSMFRLLGMIIGSYLYLLITKEKRIFSLNDNKFLIHKDKVNSLKWMIVRSSLLFFGFIFAIYGISNIKQITYSLVLNLGPILNNLIAPIFLDQKFKKYYLYITIISFIGVAIMVYGSYSSKQIVDENSNQDNSSIFGILSVFLYSLSNIITNYSLVNLSNDYDSYNLILYSSIFGFIIAILYFIITKGIVYILFYIPLRIAVNGIINGIIMFFVSNYLFYSFKYAETQKIIYISYIQIPLLSLFGYVYANETVNFLEFLGGVILFATIFYTYKSIS